MTNDEFRIHWFDVRTAVFDHAVVFLIQRPIILHGDNRMDMDARSTARQMNELALRLRTMAFESGPAFTPAWLDSASLIIIIICTLQLRSCTRGNRARRPNGLSKHGKCFGNGKAFGSASILTHQESTFSPAHSRRMPRLNADT